MSARLHDLYRPVEERVRDFREVERSIPDADLLAQAERCQSCGVPFCHGAGCPLGNRVPDQNRAAARGDWRRAWELLSSTSDFPEFTSRVCPALCEAACVRQLDEESVLVRQLEKRIVDTAFASGWVVPRPPARENGKRVAVVGAGPSGLSAAVTLRRRGWTVTVYEKERNVGGLLRYGIPCFKLDKSAIDRRRAILEAGGVRFVTGIEVGRDVAADYLLRANDALVLAIGTPAARDLRIPGRDLAGIHFALELLGGENRFRTGETDASPISCKGKRVLVIGGGDTGSDCVGTARRHGAASVAQIELLPKPPDERGPSTPWPQWPWILRTSSSHLEGCDRRWCLNSLRFVAGDAGDEGRKTQDASCMPGPGTCGPGTCDAGAPRRHVAGVEVETVEWELSPVGRPLKFRSVPGTKEILEADLVFLALGFTGVPADLPLLAQLGIAPGPRGALAAQPAGNVCCVGDCASGASLVVRAIASGKALPL